MMNLQSLNLSTFMLAGATALSTLTAVHLTGCAGDEFTVGTSDGGTGGDGGSGGDGGTGGDGGGGPILGTQYIPKSVRPTLGEKLPPMRAYLQWAPPSAIPDGKAIDHYDVCWATGTVLDLGTETECPNAATASNPYSAIASLTASTQYFWKVRANYGDGTTSYYSSAFPFRTDNRLAAWLLMDETSGTTAADKSGNGNAGSLKNGATFAPGFLGNALQLDGTDDYADMGGNAGLELNGPLTVSAWVKGNGIPTSADSGILNLGAFNYALTYHTNSAAYFYIGNSANQVHATLSPDVWHHVVGTFDGTTLPGGMNLYIDGIPAATKASSASTTGAAANLWIGRSATSYFRGLIDDAAVYADTLDADGVINQYCAALVLSGAATLPSPCQ